MAELNRSSMYFLGIDVEVLKGIQDTNPKVYQRFFKLPYVDELTVGEEGNERRIIWFRYPCSLEPMGHGKERLEKAKQDMESAGVPQGSVHVYRQTLTLEQVD